MIWPVYLFYVLIVGFIRIYKWIELQVLRVFTRLIKSFVKKRLEEAGIVLHCPDDPKWSSTDNKRVLSKCSPKYDSLIHVNIHDNDFFPRVANSNVLGTMESYLDKNWDVEGTDENSTQFGYRLLKSNSIDMYYNWWNSTLEWLELYAFNLQTRKRAFEVGVVHYDLGK